jgi:rhodanese-related sulfurtransferase
MPISINRSEVQRLVAGGAQLVEVLPEEEYAEEHLPGAIHLPLKSLTARSARTLDRSRPVVVYCWDALCDMSPRAAWDLERFGFDPVFDYTTGKADWIAAGLTTVGEGRRSPRVTEQMDLDVPTCDVAEPVVGVVRRAIAMGWDMAVVVNQERVIVGRVRVSTVDAEAESVAGEVMESGPTTVHADADLAATLARLKARRVKSVIVSTPDGRLLGVLRANQ